MGAVCCCCRKEANIANNQNEDEVKKDSQNNDPLNDLKKPNPYKSTEVETLNGDKDILLSESKEQDLNPRSPRKKSLLNVIENPEMKNSDFFIKIWIETLEINYKLCDDFGNIFKPFVEVLFDKQSKTMNTMDEEKLNLSNISENADVNISYFAMIPSVRKSGINSAIIHKEKFYYFKNGVDFNGNDENKYSSILFSIKNENTHGHLKILPAITIGQIRIPIKVLLNQKDRSFEGYLYLKLREVVEIGQLKVKIQCVDNLLNTSISVINNDSQNNNFMVKNIDDDDVK